MGLGLDYIEKHVTLDRSKKGVDYYSSIEPKDLGNFINKMKKIKKVLVTIYLVSANMKKNTEKEVKKIWYSNEDIKKNTKIKSNLFKMKRPHIQNITPFFIEDIINFKNKKNLSSEETITNLKIKIKKLLLLLLQDLNQKDYQTKLSN